MLVERLFTRVCEEVIVPLPALPQSVGLLEDGPLTSPSVFVDMSWKHSWLSEARFASSMQLASKFGSEAFGFGRLVFLPLLLFIPPPHA